MLVFFAVSFTGNRAIFPLDTLQLEAPPVSLPHNYGVIGVRLREVPPSQVLISKVGFHSPAAAAGLLPGDQIIAIPPYRIRSTNDLSRCIQSFEPGTKISILIRRNKVDSLVACQVTDVGTLHFLMTEAAGDSASAFTLPTGYPDMLEREISDLLIKFSSEHVLLQLTDTFAKELRRYNSVGLPPVHLLMNNPLSGVRFARFVSESLAAAQRPEDYLRLVAELRHGNSSNRIFAEALSSEPRYQEIGETLVAALAETNEIIEQAFSSVEPADRRFLMQQWPALLDRFAASHYLDEGDFAETAAHVRILTILQQIDQRQLSAAAFGIAQLATDSSVARLRTLASRLPGAIANDNSNFRGRLLYKAESPYGTILVGGEGPNYYGRDAALILDLGGDDVYSNNCGAPPTMNSYGSVAIVIDLDGDDRYFADKDVAIGAAVGGVGLLFDKGGNDIYVGRNLTQGSSFGGAGLLWDSSGDDIYIGSQASQAAAFFGMGLLVDEQGSDFYAAWQIAQGFGGSGGIGILHDIAGEDFYIGDEAVPSLYNVAGEYSGWSQGVGCGFRGFTPGGIGLLIDRQGNDRYQGGDFSQGVGYFFAVGMLYDGEGNDEYFGRRYAQGAAAHQAVGIALDDGGDDQYTAHVAGAQGSAWDAAVGILQDAQGHDRYRCGNLCQGSGSMNGLGAFLDKMGNDVYTAESGQGHGGSSKYWGGRHAKNLGVFVDLQGDDQFRLRRRLTELDELQSGVGLFLDR